MPERLAGTSAGEGGTGQVLFTVIGYKSDGQQWLSDSSGCRTAAAVVVEFRDEE